MALSNRQHIIIVVSIFSVIAVIFAVVKFDNWYTAKREYAQARENRLRAESRAKEQLEKLLANKASALETAIATKDTNPAAGLAMLEAYQAFKFDEISAATAQLLDAKKAKDIAAAKEFLRTGDHKRAFDATLPSGHHRQSNNSAARSNRNNQSKGSARRDENRAGRARQGWRSTRDDDGEGHAIELGDANNDKPYHHPTRHPQPMGI